MTTCWLWEQISFYPSVANNREVWLSPLASCLCKSDYILSFALWCFYVNILEVTLSEINQNHAKNYHMTLLSSNPRPLKTDDHWFSVVRDPGDIHAVPHAVCYLWDPKSDQIIVCIVGSVKFNHCTILIIVVTRAYHLICWGKWVQSIPPHCFCIIHCNIILPYSSRYLLQWYFLFNIWRVILNSVCVLCLHIHTTICTCPSHHIFHFIM
jgi:hypothetical protein